MKKLFVTSLTLIFTIAYFGMAQAQTKPVAPVVLAGGGSELASQHKSKTPLKMTREPRSKASSAETTASKTPVAADTDADKTAKSVGHTKIADTAKEVTKTDTAKPTDNKNNKVWVKGTATSKEVKDIKFEVKENDKGEFSATASDAGCSECASHEVKIEKGDIPQLKSAALKAMRQFYGEVKDTTAKEDEKELSAEEQDLKDKKETCQINKDGKYFKTDELKAACFKKELTRLTESADPANDEKIAALEKALLKLYIKDLTLGKTDSAIIKLVQSNIADITRKITSGKQITTAESRFYEGLVEIQAKGNLTVLEKRNTELQAQFTLANNSINSGNFDAAKAAIGQLTNSKKAFASLVAATQTSIANTKYQSESVGLNTAVTDFDVTLLKLNTNLVAAQSKSGGKSTTASSIAKKFGFSLDSNTAVDSAAGTGNTLVNTQADFDRMYAKSIRGLKNDDFLGTSPTLRPDANIGTGATALTQNNGNIINGANTNTNPTLTTGTGSPTARFAGRR